VRKLVISNPALLLSYSHKWFEIPLRTNRKNRRWLCEREKKREMTPKSNSQNKKNGVGQQEVRSRMARSGAKEGRFSHKLFIVSSYL
jgi:hypothetical protein